MEGLFVLLALIPIALLILLIMNLARMTSVRNEMRLMREQMHALANRLGHGAENATSPLDAPPLEPDPAPEPVLPHLIPVPVLVEQPPASIPIPPPLPDLPLITVVEPELVVPPAPPPPRRPSFLERNPDLEKFIGENLINKIGIAILVIGLGLLLRYAIGKNLISETGRTLIGIGSGALLLFFAHRLRTTFKGFSSVLVGGGLAVLYFSIGIAFQQYHIIQQTPAFLVMVGTTAIGVLLTLVYDRRELAVIALLGGFASPFMASNGTGNYVVLFSYLLILNAGMLVLANYKKWHLINVITFLITSAIFGAWLSMSFVELEPRPVWPTFAFATAFFLVFFTMNVRYNLRHGSLFVPLDFSLLLANTAVYFAAGLSILQHVRPSLDGAFTVVLAVFHLVFAWAFYKRANAPKHLVYLLIGLVLTFLSLTGPLQLHGNHITLFWSAEAVLLLWFSLRTGIRLVERSSVLVAVLGIISLFMDMAAHYDAYPLLRLAPVINRPWIAGMVTSIALFFYGRLCQQLPADRPVLFGPSPSILRNIVWVAATILLFLVNFLEIEHQLSYLFEEPVVAMALTAYALAALAVLFFVVRKATPGFRIAVLVVTIIGLLYYITGFYAHSMHALLDLRTGAGGRGFAPFHVAALFAAILAVACLASTARRTTARRSGARSAYLWSICTFLVILCSQELDHALLLGTAPTSFDPVNEAWMLEAGPRFGLMHALDDLRKAGYPILWGLGSFVLMWYGMRTRQRMVRVIALSLFGLTLVKLFLFDIRGISEGGKVAAFICLGILLLVVSFMYNKLKGLLKDDGSQPPPLP